MIRVILKYFQSRSWPTYFPTVILNINIRPHTSTGYSPEFVMNSLHPIMTDDIISKQRMSQIAMDRRILIAELRENIAHKNAKNTKNQIRRATVGGATIAGPIAIDCAVLVAPPTAQLKTKDSGFNKKAVVVENCGNGYYKIRFQETGGYRQTETVGSTATYHRSHLKPYSFGDDHQLTMEQPEVIPDESCSKQIEEEMERLELEDMSDLEIGLEDFEGCLAHLAEPPLSDNTWMSEPGSSQDHIVPHIQEASPTANDETKESEPPQVAQTSLSSERTVMIFF
ncbi:hypothetical protein FDP41_003646 [Naegleria fowleri]|uniref:Uncharacterized protein n=1 Tax=Naegleria fowleri TaxID=5763 RepID=A0A6A5BTT6_NAEFO|nr:uncharacterized protein FDP41_003646 [Naegleria fowleri]KAF0977654.1 hypothetical protein FDP41_003646 [Naegleria fowleri]